MSRAKMVILTPDQHMHATIAVMTQLRADRGAKRTPGEEYDKFLSSQIAIGAETLNALNATTVTATAVMASDAARGTLADLDGDRLKTVIAAMQQLVKIQRGEKWATLGGPTNDAMVDALLFLESPK